MPCSAQPPDSTKHLAGPCGWESSGTHIRHLDHSWDFKDTCTLADALPWPHTPKTSQELGSELAPPAYGRASWLWRLPGGGTKWSNRGQILPLVEKAPYSWLCTKDRMECGRTRESVRSVGVRGPQMHKGPVLLPKQHEKASRRPGVRGGEADCCD